MPTIADEIIKTMPQVVVGHRSRENAHEGLAATIQGFLSRMPPEEFFQSEVQYCGHCSTDFEVTCRYQGPLDSKVRTIEITVEVWRNLGVGRNPFETWWRAHGETQGQRIVGNGNSWGSMSKSEAGEIKDAFKREGEMERLGPFGTLNGQVLVPKMLDDIK
jgi:hypothetical protein